VHQRPLSLYFQRANVRPNHEIETQIKSRQEDGLI